MRYKLKQNRREKAITFFVTAAEARALARAAKAAKLTRSEYIRREVLRG